LAREYATAHESGAPPGDPDSAMDLYNNFVGRRIGLTSTLPAYDVTEAINNFQLMWIKSSPLTQANPQPALWSPP
jgi:hypothetical protein